MRTWFSWESDPDPANHNPDHDPVNPNPDLDPVNPNPDPYPGELNPDLQLCACLQFCVNQNLLIKLEARE